MAFPGVVEGKYRNHLSGEGEKDTKWKFGVPPNYNVVNKSFSFFVVFNSECVLINFIYIWKIWPPRSVGEQVQEPCN